MPFESIWFIVDPIETTESNGEFVPRDPVPRSQDPRTRDTTNDFCTEIRELRGNRSKLSEADDPSSRNRDYLFGIENDELFFDVRSDIFEIPSAPASAQLVVHLTSSAEDESDEL